MNKLYIVLFFIILSSIYIYKKKNISQQVSSQVVHEKMPIIVPPTRDIVTEYDYKNLLDPFQEPGRRSSRFDMINMISNPHINIPSRGYPDSYSVQGYLVDDHNNVDVNDPNKIIRLYGRQSYPTGSEWQYYVEINIGNDKLKTDLCKNRREIFDGDMVYVELIKRNYRVKLLKNKTLEYNPFLY